MTTTIYKSVEVDVEIDVDIEDIWCEMDTKQQAEFLRKAKSASVDAWQDFVYELDDEDTVDLVRWLKFYNKIQ